MSNVSTNSTGSTSSRTRGRVVGVPRRCWCGERIVALISKSDPNPYRRYYHCGFAVSNRLRNDDHTFKWDDEASVNEIDTLTTKNVEFEKHLKYFRKERLEFEKIVYEKMENEIFETIEDALSKAKTSNRKMMVILAILCMIMIGCSKLLG
ncbi:PREDICTED: uncharacterized protein At4g04775-like [Camelina sativa]|uniref:Uncharacterized protein At4g04775-like n=1 Tax=Camelina sativa TaxID=90675 RepID=A0ABM0YJE2_CAMSA|nr:PREDICTED: uncharacterized protein At4g04775-like [Camelina sativa]